MVVVELRQGVTALYPKLRLWYLHERSSCCAAAFGVMSLVALISTVLRRQRSWIVFATVVYVT